MSAGPAPGSGASEPPDALPRTGPVWQSAQGFVDLIRAAAGRAAEEASLEPIVTIVSPHDHALWLERFDAPARTKARLSRTMRSRAPWDPE